MTIALPKWLKDMEQYDARTHAARLRYLVKVAALYHSPHGTLTKLAQDMGCTNAALSVLWTADRASMSLPLASRMEAVVGPEFLTVEMLRPTRFPILRTP